jgi:hypothetical protein
MARQKVEYSPNLPTIIELDGPGTAQASQNGAQEWRYFLQGERITWVPETVHQAIVATGADHPGATFRITKHQAKARAPITWEVERVDGAREHLHHGYSNQASPPPPPVTYERTPQQGWIGREAPPPQRQPQPAAKLASEAPELPIGPADRMAAALRDAIDLVRGAREYEPSLTWDASDVRALAATIFIETSKGARQ